MNSHFFPRNFHHRSFRSRTKHSSTSKTISPQPNDTTVFQSFLNHSMRPEALQRSIELKTRECTRRAHPQIELTSHTMPIRNICNVVKFRCRTKEKTLCVRGIIKQPVDSKEIKQERKLNIRLALTATNKSRGRKYASYMLERQATLDGNEGKRRLIRDATVFKGWDIVDEDFSDVFN